MRTVFKGCLIAFVLVAGLIAWITIPRYREVSRIDASNVAAAKGVVRAIDSYRASHHHYPASLSDLHLDLSKLGLYEATQLYFAVSADGSQYWLAVFPYHDGHLFMPSDEVDEYSSAMKSWTILDVNDSRAYAAGGRA